VCCSVLGPSKPVALSITSMSIQLPHLKSRHTSNNVGQQK